MGLIKRIIKIMVWGVVGLYLAAVIMVRTPLVQQWLGGKVAAAIGKKLDTRVTVDKVHLGLVNKFVVDGIDVYDKDDRLMISASRIAAKIDIGRLVGD